MNPLVILVPVLSRPQAVKPLVESIAETAEGVHVAFIAEPQDEFEREAIREVRRSEWRCKVSLFTQAGSYARKANAGIRFTNESLIFLGADDLRFRAGWREAAEAKIPPAQVVGVNDLLKRRRVHTTHFLITRAYAARGTIDGQTGALSEAYEHNYVDDELIATATQRGVYAYAEDSHVEHLHPMNAKAEIDDTYRKGFETMRRDRHRFEVREAMWTS